MAGGRRGGARMGAAARLRSVHPVERVERWPAFRAAAGDHQGQLPSCLPVRRLPVWDGAARPAAAVEGPARIVRERSESVCGRSLRGPRSPCRDAAARPDLVRVLHRDRRCARAGDAVDHRAHRDVGRPGRRPRRWNCSGPKRRTSVLACRTSRRRPERSKGPRVSCAIRRYSRRPGRRICFIRSAASRAWPPPS